MRRLQTSECWLVSVDDYLRIFSEQLLRSEYARRAEAVGATTVAPSHVLQRVLVFLDYSCPERVKNLASFNKNVLPLLQLAGMDVKIESAANADELHAFSRAADVRNCAGICIIGTQKYAAPHILDGLFASSSSDH